MRVSGEADVATDAGATTRIGTSALASEGRGCFGHVGERRQIDVRSAFDGQAGVPERAPQNVRTAGPGAWLKCRCEAA
jgi:hypothetical protein